MVIGWARRCSSGKSTCTLSHSAWKPAKRSVIAWKAVRTASRWSSPLRRPKSVRLLETNSLRRKVRNFSYCLRKPPVGQLVLFSTETGDAWLLDPSDQLAAKLASDGDPESVAFEET